MGVCYEREPGWKWCMFLQCRCHFWHQTDTKRNSKLRRQRVMITDCSSLLRELITQEWEIAPSTPVLCCRHQYQLTQASLGCRKAKWTLSVINWLWSSVKVDNICDSRCSVATNHKKSSKFKGSGTRFQKEGLYFWICPNSLLTQCRKSHTEASVLKNQNVVWPFTQNTTLI